MKFQRTTTTVIHSVRALTFTLMILLQDNFIHSFLLVHSLLFFEKSFYFFLWSNQTRMCGSVLFSGSTVYGCGWTEWRSFHRISAFISTTESKSRLCVQCVGNNHQTSSLSSSISTLNLTTLLNKEHWEIRTVPTRVNDLTSFSVKQICSGPLHWCVLGTEITDNNNNNTNTFQKRSEEILVFGGPTSLSSNGSVEFDITDDLSHASDFRPSISFLNTTYWGVLIQYSLQNIK